MSLEAASTHQAKHYRSFVPKGALEKRHTGAIVADLPLMRPEGSTLAGQESYSQSVARLFNIGSAQTTATTILKTGQLAVTRLRSDLHGTGVSSPLPAERAYAVILQLRDAAGNELWKSGRRVPAEPLVAGSIVIAHLEDEPAFNLRDPFDMLLIHIPQIVFDELAEDHGAPRIGRFADEAGAPDAVVHDLGRALLPCLGARQQSPQPFFDHVAIAIHARLASRFGQLEQRPMTSGCTLTPRQERAAKDALAADLSSEPVMTKVALACGLSVSRLVRAFRNTTGMPPHRWLRSFRVERAKDLLLNSSLALGQIAYDCGFADQSHFTRVFSRMVKTSPAAWARVQER